MAAPPPPTTTTRAITALTALPAVRVPLLRPGRTPNLARSTNYEAYIGSIVGAINVPPCTHCLAGNGQWAVCVSVAGFFAGSCTNCHYNSEGARCSLRPGAAPTPTSASAAPPAPIGAPTFSSLLATAVASAAGPSGSSSRPPHRQTRRLPPVSYTNRPLGQVAPIPRIVDRVAPGNNSRFHRRTGMVRVARRTPLERARRFAELYKELAALYEEEAEVREEDAEVGESGVDSGVDSEVEEEMLAELEGLGGEEGRSVPVEEEGILILGEEEEEEEEEMDEEGVAALVGEVASYLDGDSIYS